MAGATKIKLMAAALASLEPLIKGKSTIGKVTMRPPPINKVVTYWLQEMRKVTMVATPNPGKMAATIHAERRDLENARQSTAAGN